MFLLRCSQCWHTAIVFSCHHSPRTGILIHTRPRYHKHYWWVLVSDWVSHGPGSHKQHEPVSIKNAIYIYILITIVRNTFHDTVWRQWPPNLYLLLTLLTNKISVLFNQLHPKQDLCSLRGEKNTSKNFSLNKFFSHIKNLTFINDWFKSPKSIIFWFTLGSRDRWRPKSFLF